MRSSSWLRQPLHPNIQRSGEGLGRREVDAAIGAEKGFHGGKGLALQQLGTVTKAMLFVDKVFAIY